MYVRTYIRRRIVYARTQKTSRMESPQTGGRTAQEARVKRDGLASSGKAPLQLTEEEKGVLMECRRNSTARGSVGVACSDLGE